MSVLVAGARGTGTGGARADRKAALRVRGFACGGRRHGARRDPLATIDRFDRADVLLDASRYRVRLTTDAVRGMDEMNEQPMRHDRIAGATMTPIRR